MSYLSSVVRYLSSDRGHSSVGRAPALQAGGRRFDPVWLHQTVLIEDSCDRRRLRSKTAAIQNLGGQCRRCQRQKLVRGNPKFARSRLVVRRKTAVDARVLSDIVK